jgi:hypothetical protein
MAVESYTLGAVTLIPANISLENNRIFKISLFFDVMICRWVIGACMSW